MRLFKIQKTALLKLNYKQLIFNIMKTTILSLVLLLLASCQDNKKEQLLHLVKEWQGKEIRFPEKPVFTRFVTDTTDYRIPAAADYKVVVYVDSIGCVSCKLQLRKWKEFIAQVDSATDGNVPFLFFFQSKDNDELRYILRRDNFTLPVCIDTDNHFYKLNHFPGEMTFQSFLVDRDNHVKVIGNPIHNLSVRDLYLKGTDRGRRLFPARHTPTNRYPGIRFRLSACQRHKRANRPPVQHRNGNFPTERYHHLVRLHHRPI